MAENRFLSKYRLRLADEFAAVYARRRSASDSLLLVHGGKNALPYCRLGLSVSRKVGGAVVRNRWKRLLREAFRQAVDELPPGVDLIVAPRPGSAPELGALKTSLKSLSHRIAARLERDPP